MYDGSQDAPVVPFPRSPQPVSGRNVYVCPECRQAIVTEDVDPGTTPMFLACRATENCGGAMQSQMYPPEPWPTPFPAAIAVGSGRDLHMERIEVELPEVGWQWFRPDERAMREMDAAMFDHVSRGGLDLREIGAGS